MHLSPNFSNILDCDSSELKKSQPSDFLDRYIYPADRAILTIIQSRFLSFVINLPDEERMYYKYISKFRIWHKGKWIWVTDQEQLLGTGSDNEPVILGITDIASNQSSDQAVDYRLVDFRTADIVPLMPDGTPVANRDTYETADTGNIMEKNRLYIESLIQVNNTCVYILERKHNSLLYMSPNFSDLWGYPPLELTQKKYRDYLVRNIHPDDMEAYRNIRNRMLKFFDTLSVQQQSGYMYVFGLRARHKGRWIRIICRHRLLGISSGNTPVIMGIIDISPDQSPAQTVSFQLVNSKTGEIAPFPMCENDSNRLTKRELEILMLVNQGMPSREIAGKLSISIHTVNRHRQNIIQKMDVKNMAEAFNLAYKLGLLA